MSCESGMVKGVTMKGSMDCRVLAGECEASHGNPRGKERFYTHHLGHQWLLSSTQGVLYRSQVFFHFAPDSNIAMPV